MKRIKEILDLYIVNLENFQLQVSDILMVIIIIIVARFILFSFSALVSRLGKTKSLDERNGRNFVLLFKYFLWVIATVLILESLGFSITILLAGSAALLVGIGLGLQQIFSDIISGIFLLLEASVQVGDIMEVDGLVGKVTTINLRTSEILSRDGISIIIPNHKFISDNVINWSHNETITRFEVTVGVAYGSEPELVKQILLDTAKENGDIVSNKNYPSMVRLINFGDSSLDFQLLFWSRKGFTIENVKSELRFTIIKKFHENGIVIPFPQRDLYIKSNVK